MNEKSLAFWRVIKLVQLEIESNPEAMISLKASPAQFLRDRSLDVQIDAGSIGSETLSALLENSSETERRAIVESLLSLVDRMAPPTRGQTQQKIRSDFDLTLIVVNAIANANVFINSNAVQNANANANQLANSIANANQALNLNANANANTNATSNATGLGYDVDARGVPNSRNNITVELPEDYSSSEVCSKFRGLKLTEFRQRALLKRAVLDSQIFVDSSRQQLVTSQVYSYKYRDVALVINARFIELKLIIESVKLG